jgi:hypothetical protein
MYVKNIVLNGNMGKIGFKLIFKGLATCGGYYEKHEKWKSFEACDEQRADEKSLKVVDIFYAIFNYNIF